MRSVAPGSFERLSGVAALWAAWSAHARGKRRKPAIATYDLDVDRRLLALHRELRAGTYAPAASRQHVVHEPKIRLISTPALRDRIVHQAVVGELAPAFERGYHPRSFACRPGLGPPRAVLHHLACSRRFAFRLHLDIRRYFPSIDHGILLGLVRRRIRPEDARTIELVDRLVDAGGAVYRTPLAVVALGLEADPVAPACGLAIGSCLSQWAANLYLDGADHFITRTLKVPGYLRYMDDLTLFADSRGQLAEAREAVVEWLARERQLGLSSRSGAVVPASEPCTYLGARISRAGLGPSRKVRRRLARNVRHAAAAGEDALIRCIRSYRGLLMVR